MARATQIRERLSRAIPEPRTELDHANAWQLLVATILSAQSTDRNVNRVSPALFRRFPTPAALGAASQEDVEGLVRSTGFFRSKARAIRETSRLIAERHGGEVPRSIEELTELPGVARKTANVVLGSAFGIPSGVVVDTHVGRVARRLELSCEQDPVKVETELCALFPRASWIEISHRLVLHGRYVCTARDPSHGECPLFELCPSAEGKAEGRWTERADAERRLVEARGQARLGEG
jgi:endonuclease-3